MGARPTVGVVGLGKLGLPLAVTLALEGFPVVGCDRDPARMSPSALADWELDRQGAGRLIDEWDAAGGSGIRFVPLHNLVTDADCVLVAVETPHEALYEGVTPLPSTRADFEYAALRRAVSDIVATSDRQLTIGIISTVLPGTLRREILPVTDGHNLVYCPQFIAMGHVAQDFLEPEFVLIGTETDDSTIASVFGQLAPHAPVLRMAIESAELTKTIYNTYISTKVAISNLIQQVSARTGADAREVFDAVQQAGKRITSGAYIGPGLGDGGPCHPRDNIALSWLSRNLGLRSDLFTSVMDVRFDYMTWLADEFVVRAGDLPMVVLGSGYKAGVSLETGSPAVLLARIMRDQGRSFRFVPAPHDVDLDDVARAPSAYFIGCPEPAFYRLPFSEGSLVFDPWYLATATTRADVVFPGSDHVAAQPATG